MTNIFKMFIVSILLIIILLAFVAILGNIVAIISKNIFVDVILFVVIWGGVALLG